MQVHRGPFQHTLSSSSRPRYSARALATALALTLMVSGLLFPSFATAAASASTEAFDPCAVTPLEPIDPAGPSLQNRSLSDFLLPARSTVFSASSDSNIRDLLKVGDTLLPSLEQTSDKLPYGIRFYSLSVDEAPESTLIMGQVKGVSPQAHLAAWKARENYGGQIEAGSFKIHASALKVVDPTESDRIANTQYQLRAHQSLQALEFPIRDRGQIALRLGVDAQVALDHGIPIGSAIPNASVEWSRPLGRYSQLRLEAYTGVRSRELSPFGFQGDAPPLEVGARASLLQF